MVQRSVASVLPRYLSIFTANSAPTEVSIDPKDLGLFVLFQEIAHDSQTCWATADNHGIIFLRHYCVFVLVLAVPGLERLLGLPQIDWEIARNLRRDGGD